jgi:Uma2 family endonuclease
MNAPSFPALEQANQRSPEVPVMPEEPVLPLSVEGYHALLKAGILQDGDPVELLEGFMVPKMTKGPRHELVRRRVMRRFLALIPSEFFVDSQGAATLLTSEPEPDIFVIRGTEEDYADRHAGPAETVIVVEIADSSVRRDRNWKKRIYARAGVPSYWVVNLVDDHIEVFNQPSGDTPKPAYATTGVYQLGDSVPVMIDGNEIGQIDVAAILGESQSQK